MRRTVEAHLGHGDTITVVARDELLVDLWTRLGFGRVTSRGARLSYKLGSEGDNSPRQLA